MIHLMKLFFYTSGTIYLAGKLSSVALAMIALLYGCYRWYQTIKRFHLLRCYGE